MSSSVDQIKSKLDIVTVVSAYIKLDKAGMNFKGKCPFHNEKTPSFFVSPDRGGYYCFGCHAKGDIFTFVQEFEGLDFVGALKVLADRAGVVLEKFDKGDKTGKDRLYSALEQAVFFYQKKLSENKTALEYLHNRGVTDKTISDFRIGFAPSEWRDLYEYLLERGVTDADMLAVGLVKKKDDGGNHGGNASVSRPYDTFRGRIMFPIADSSGRVVAFSGRTLVSDDKSPKYVNSPETELFHKSDVLFGLDKAKKDIRIKDYSVLVEGQMDLVMLHQAGITNTVASSGTALTADHLVRLRRLSNNLMMFFDGDDAGFNASNRSAKIALSFGMELKLVSMPDGKDPADLAKESVDALRECLKGAKNIVDFYVDSLLARKLSPKELSVEVRKNVLPYVAELPHKTDRDDAVKAIVRKTYINEEALKDDLSQIRGGVAVDDKKFHSSPPISRIESIERKIIGIILWQKSLSKPTEDIENKLEEIISRIPPEQREGNKSYKALATTELLFETEAYYNSNNNEKNNDGNNLAGGVKKEAEELLRGLEEEYLKKEFSDVMVKLQRAEQEKDAEQIKKYLEECQRISKEINQVKNSQN